MLYLSNNQLRTLPSGIFNDLHSLIFLDLSNNQLQVLPNDIFGGLANLAGLFLVGNPFRADFIVNLPNIIRSIPSLKLLDLKPIDEALQSYRVYQPKLLRESTLEYLMQNLTPDELEQLALTEHPAFELLSLTPQQRAEIIAKNIESYRHKLHELPSEILDLLPLNPTQRAGIAAQKRQIGQQ
jgi:hypothetical protein